MLPLGSSSHENDLLGRENDFAATFASLPRRFAKILALKV
jgi:hypothetical protein